MSGQFLAVLLFSFITLAFGYSVLSLVRATKPKNFLVYILEVIGVGIATFAFMAVVFNLLHIPLNIYIYVGLALVVPIIDLAYAIKDKEKWEFGVPWNEETICIILLLIIMIAFFSLYHKGANVYPYLEDDDPWGHAEASMYVAATHTYTIDPQVREINGLYAFYLEPYPPTYDVIMGLMRQVNDSIVWTLKFFNVLLITLGLAFFFLLAKIYLKSDLKAIFATFMIACLPSFMSHFIWSQTLAIILFPIALYAIIKALDDKTWRIPAMILIASELVTQPVVSFIFGITVLLLVLFVFLHEWQARKGWTRSINGFIVGAGGVAVSLLYWGWQIIRWGGINKMLAIKGSEFKTGWVGSYALQKYGLMETIFAPNSSRIDQAIGWGPVITLCLVIGFVMVLLSAKRTLVPKKGWVHIHLLIWFIFMFIIVFSPSFGLPGWGSSRMWPELAIPLVLLATEGTFILVSSLSKKQVARLGILLILAIGIAVTSVPAKVAVQTAMWPPGAQWVAQEELSGYVQMYQSPAIPKNSRVWPFCGGEQRAIGFDMQAEPWDLETARFRQRGPNVTAAEAFAFLTLHNYQYITIDATCVQNWGINATTDFVQRLNEMQRLEPIITQSGFLLARVH
jgi:hypothetical protein